MKLDSVIRISGTSIFSFKNLVNLKVIDENLAKEFENWKRFILIYTIQFLFLQVKNLNTGTASKLNSHVMLVQYFCVFNETEQWILEFLSSLKSKVQRFKDNIYNIPVLHVLVRIQLLTDNLFHIYIWIL